MGKNLTEDDIIKILANHKDILSSAVKEDERWRKSVPCPECGSYSHSEYVNQKRPFSPGKMVPNFIQKCNECACEYDHASRIIIKTSKLR